MSRRPSSTPQGRSERVGNDFSNQVSASRSREPPVSLWFTGCVASARGGTSLVIRYQHRFWGGWDPPEWDPQVMGLDTLHHAWEPTVHGAGRPPYGAPMCR